ncbi:hypothetical protein pb186bvf_004112 [Paramecium bursaria]
MINVGQVTNSINTLIYTCGYIQKNISTNTVDNDVENLDEYEVEQFFKLSVTCQNKCNVLQGFDDVFNKQQSNCLQQCSESYLRALNRNGKLWTHLI